MGEARPEQYRVTEAFDASGKLCLVLGAAGNAGGHFALGMPAACKVDVVLADDMAYQEEMDEVVRDFKTSLLPVKMCVEMIRDEDTKEREALYEKLEEKYGPFACILDVYDLNTQRKFPGSSKIIQGPVVKPQDMKPRYSEMMTYPGKTVLIIGAGGLWGSHIAAGMAAAEANVLLLDTEEKMEAIEELIKVIGDRDKVRVVCVSPEVMADRAAILKYVEETFGMPESIIDVRAINPARNDTGVRS